MSTYPLETILLKWKRGELSAEQAIGHLIQHLLAQAARIQALERQLQ